MPGHALGCIIDATDPAHGVYYIYETVRNIVSGEGTDEGNLG